MFGICCAFTAPVLALAEDEGGGINLRGGSSTGKTTIVDVAASAWGKPSRSGRDPFTRSWRQTDNALEETALAHNHVLLPLDELGEADPAKLGAALYMLSNGQGKGRQLAGGGARRTASFLTLVLSSSEESAASLVEQAHKRFKAGQEVRMLDVPATIPTGFGCFETLHGAADGAAFQQAMRKAMQAHFGTAGPAFVAWLADQLARSPDLIAETVLPRVAAWCRDYLPGTADGQVHRAARRLGMVAIAGEMAIEAGIVAWPKGTAAAMVGAVLGDWIAERGGSGSREDHHLFVAFRRFIGMHGASRFAVVGNPDDHNPKDDGAQVEPPLTAGPHVMAQAGWRWEEITEIGERVWIYGILQEVFDAEIAGPLGMEPRDAAARLGSGGFIRKFMEGGETRWKRKFRIAGRGRPRLMVAEAHVLEAE